MTPNPQEAERELHDQINRLRSFARRVLRFWPSLPIALLVGGIACALFLHLRKPMYRSETVVLYSQGTAPGDTAEQSGPARNVTVRLKELLMSRPKLERVIGEFGLYSDVRRDAGMTEAVEELKKNIEYRAPGGDTFSIGFTGSTPIETQRVTQRLVALVIEQDSELRRNQARVTRDFLVAEKAKTEATLRASERNLAGFMAKYPRFALDATPLATGAAIRATTLPNVGSGTLAPSIRSRAFSSGNASPSGGSAPRSQVVPPADADSDLARANAAVAAARANLGEQLEHFTPAHPDVRAAQAALERAESRLSALGPGSTPARSAAPAAIEPANETKAANEANAPPSRGSNVPVRVAAAPSGNGAAAPARDLVALETEWLKLTRAVTEARQRQDQVESALFKADIQASSESGGRGLSMTIIDPAYLPARPLPPGRTLVAAIFMAVSFLLGVFVALIRAVLDDRIFEARDAFGPAELLVEIPRRGALRRVHVAS